MVDLSWANDSLGCPRSPSGVNQESIRSQLRVRREGCVRIAWRPGSSYSANGQVTKDVMGGKPSYTPDEKLNVVLSVLNGETTQMDVVPPLRRARRRSRNGSAKQREDRSDQARGRADRPGRRADECPRRGLHRAPGMAKKGRSTRVRRARRDKANPVGRTRTAPWSGAGLTPRSCDPLAGRLTCTTSTT